MRQIPIFKILYLLVAVLFLVIAYHASENRRYVYYSDDSLGKILDTRTGMVYMVSSGDAMKLDFVNGHYYVNDVKRDSHKSSK